ncbi:MAG: hypothetical protein E7617_06110 [Ruminococcaceae bacterium]|nr:hypothetical protein [Oscillospiraceae bacterium]
MKKSALILSFFIIVSLLMSLSACALPEPIAGLLGGSVELTMDDISVECGKTYQLKTEITVTSLGKENVLPIEYTYSGDSISIDENGLLTANVAATITKVTATCGKVSTVFNVSVTPSGSSDVTCEHTFVNGECTKCGEDDPNYVPPCEHEFVNGECTKCGEDDPNYVPPCEHEFVNGECTKCGEDDPNYVPPCEHEFVNGECTKCGEDDPNYVPPCEHEFVNGECTKCGEDDPNYVPPCEHEFVNGECTKCGEDDPNYVPPCEHDFVRGECTKCGEEDPNYVPKPEDFGTMTLNAPSVIYTNYSGKEISVTFSESWYNGPVTYTVSHPNVFVENGKIFAKGTFTSDVNVTVTAKTEYHEQTATVKVSTYNGGVNAETKVQYYEQNIIKDENKGGLIFVGDSYFDGYKMTEPPFWKDFYQDFAGEKAFLMGISSSQIDDLEMVSERLVYPMQPSEIVVHIGFNDVHHGPLTTDELIARITALLQEYHAKLPLAKIYFMGVEPKKNGYSSTDQYYNSSTVKAPAVTAAMKALAEANDWLVFLETNSIFVKADGTVNKSMYLSTDLSHPTLEAYDLVRDMLNRERVKFNSDHGTMSISAPGSIYSNYAGKDIRPVFSNPRYSFLDVTYTVDNANVFIENGKIFAKGNFSSEITVTVTAKTEYHTATCTVKVSTYTGGINVENKVQYYEQNIIKDENKGGLIFVGDSYFDGYQMSEPPFWKDFYQDFAGEKAFLMGISQSQIDDLEIVSERLVYPMQPSEIVVHIGFNDVHHGPLTTDELIARITALLEEYHAKLPGAKIYFMGVEPKKNGYTEGSAYYNSSTVKAPAVTAAMKALAESKDWLTFLDTNSIFIKADGTIDQSMYLSTDLSHPTLAAYDLIRATLNANRSNKMSVTIQKYGESENINASGRTFTDASGNALKGDYFIGGKLTVTAVYKNNAHLQFRFSSDYRFLLWDQSNDGIFGAGYIGGGSVSDKSGATHFFDANNGLSLDWAIIVNDGAAYWYINGELMHKFDAPLLQYFNIGALQMNAVLYDIELIVKSEDSEGYTDAIAGYGFGEGGATTPDDGEEDNGTDTSTDIKIDDFELQYSSAAVLSNSKYIKYNGADITADYVISGKLDVTQLGNNAHLQWRFNEAYRFLLWDSNSDKTYGVGWEENNGHKNETQSGSLTFKFDASSTNTLEWTLAVTDNEAYFYINGTLVKKFTSFATTRQHLNIGASYFGAKFYDIRLTVKSADADAYAAKLAALGITY